MHTHPVVKAAAVKVAVKAAAALGVLLAALAAAPPALAQPLGTFRWQLQPYCNVLTLNVVHAGGVYTLDGFDDQCGAATRAPVTGAAVINANGTVEIGLNIVVSPGASPVHVAVPVSMTTLGGTWRDNTGGSGAFVFTPGAGTGGSPRPIPTTTQAIPNSFALLADGGFLAAGTTGVGNIPDSGPGTRMMWYPKKAAFRAGSVDYPFWDDVNVGLYSVAFGHNTAAVGAYSFAIGTDTGAFGTASLVAGASSIANANLSTAIGDHVQAGGYGSVALGSYAVTQAIASGSFAFGDRSTTTNVVSDQPNQFIVRAAGGFRFVTNAAQTTGVYLLANASQFTQISDVNKKEAFRDLDGEGVLGKLARMPIQEWSYKSQGTAIRHVGPTAQDFWAAFGLGEDPLGIGTLDGTGVALAGVKALAQRTDAMQAATAALAQENAALRAELAALRERLDALLARR